MLHNIYVNHAESIGNNASNVLYVNMVLIWTAIKYTVACQGT